MNLNKKILFKIKRIFPLLKSFIQSHSFQKTLLSLFQFIYSALKFQKKIFQKLSFFLRSILKKKSAQDHSFVKAYFSLSFKKTFSFCLLVKKIFFSSLSIFYSKLKRVFSIFRTVLIHRKLFLKKETGKTRSLFQHAFALLQNEKKKRKQYLLFLIKKLSFSFLSFILKKLLFLPSFFRRVLSTIRHRISSAAFFLKTLFSGFLSLFWNPLFKKKDRQYLTHFEVFSRKSLVFLFKNLLKRKEKLKNKLFFLKKIFKKTSIFYLDRVFYFYKRLLFFSFLKKKSFALLQKSFFFTRKVRSFIFSFYKKLHDIFIWKRKKMLQASFQFLKTISKSIRIFKTGIWYSLKAVFRLHFLLRLLFSLTLFLIKKIRGFTFLLIKIQFLFFRRLKKIFILAPMIRKMLLSLLGNLTRKNHSFSFTHSRIRKSSRYSIRVFLFSIKKMLFLFDLKKKVKEKLKRNHHIYHSHVHHKSHTTLKIFFRFILKLSSINWFKRGYQFFIFMIISLSLYSFSSNPFKWLEKKSNIQGVYSLSFDIKNSASLQIAQNLIQGHFQIVPHFQGSDILITDQFSKEAAPIYMEAFAIVVHKTNPLNNLTQKQLQLIFSGKIVNWKQLGGENKEISFYKTPDCFFETDENFAEEKAQSLLSKIKKEKNIFAILPLEHIDLSHKPLMVDWKSPSKGNIFLNRYPLARSLFALVQNKSLNSKEILSQFSKISFSSVMVGGDVMWSRGVENKISVKGIQFLIEDLSPLFQTGDISVINLETSVSHRGEKYDLNREIFFRGSPSYLKILLKMGISCVSLANNHAFDYGMTGILDTVDYLKKMNIGYFGFGLDEEEVFEGKNFEIQGKKIKFLGYTMYPRNVGASKNMPGIGVLKPETLKAEIQKAKKETDYLILFPHAGIEYLFEAEKDKKELYQKMIDYGADIVFGGHPHVIQDFEYYKGKPIFYSLGNLLFDQYRFEKTRHEVLVETLFYQGRIIAVFPYYFKVNEDFKPELMENEEIEEIMKRMNFQALD
ncbi:MAG TPA: hypothetical protein DHW82_03140 [Spirochaetia bacterium]|nr:MAG: hypothetical protein A2Y41_04040 [Spirochaetes bacterium GWB1_36_13]HCL55987.1 hypothetical protein [Spirochaetia bacterium]